VWERNGERESVCVREREREKERERKRGWEGAERNYLNTSTSGSKVSVR
jgi:hypothetical protein